MYGLKQDWVIEPHERHFVLEDYEGAVPRWCQGCGDLAVLAAVQKLVRDKQLPPEKIVSVSGIGCSSRFPHYMKTYGFHGLHGRALPVACGVKSRRPDLHVFVATGDGDCCAIGTSHWIHAVRYNMDMTATMFDNRVYGLTKMQSSPTMSLGDFSLTHPRGVPLLPINPLTVTLGIPNCSFLAQTVDWNPPHLYATLKKAHEHKGFSFVRILQRCPHYRRGAWDPYIEDTSLTPLLVHENGIELEDNVARVFKKHVEHDPSNLVQAFELALDEANPVVGLLYHNPDAVRYDHASNEGLGMSPSEKIAAINEELDRMSV